MNNFNVKDVQRALNEHGFMLKIDGISGPKTEKAILAFQKKNGLYADGVVGPVTTKILFEEPENFSDVKSLLGFRRVSCDSWDKGANVTFLREDVVQSFENVRQTLHDAGAILTSSGGRRLLNASVGKNRSQTSLHYLGIAHDLFIWGGMVDPENDPYAIERVGDRNWRVWAKCKEGVELKLKAYTYDHKTVPIEGKFVCVTEIMEQHGWHPIRARKSFFTTKNKLGAEWWHFQCESVLEDGTRFGDELLKSYKLSKLRTYSMWQHRNRIWKKDWF